MPPPNKKTKHNKEASAKAAEKRRVDRECRDQYFDDFPELG